MLGGFDLELGLGIFMRGDDQILDDLLFLGLEQALIDIDIGHPALAVERHLDEPAARLAGHCGRFELRLHLLHACLKLLYLLHHIAEILHGVSSSLSSIAGVAGPARSRTSTSSAPGK